jgi:hypothetical protein
MQDKKNRLVTILTLIGMAALMAAYFRPDLVGFADRPELPQGCFPRWHPHPFPFRRCL